MKPCFLALIACLLVTSCKAPQAVEAELQPGVKSQFETAIAEAIFQEIRNDFGQLQPASRLPYLREKLVQLNRSVNFDLVNPRTRREREILTYLLAAAEASEQDSFLLTVRRRSSLTWTLDEFRDRILQELDRLDQVIAALSLQKTGDESPVQPFDLVQHMQRVRLQVSYPEDSVRGRQDYLDQLADHMVVAQLKWYDTLQTYEPPEISLEGFEDNNALLVFDYHSPVLAINLADVSTLPLFETEPLAIYYGFPGLHALVTATRPGSIQNLLDLPGFRHGWAAYVADYTGTRDGDAPLNHLYHTRLLAAAALADFYLHTGEWHTEDAIRYLQDTTPYGRSRLTGLVAQIRSDPGYYLAVQAGKLKFVELHDTCIANNEQCSTAAFHQAIVESGQMPFRLLRSLLNSVN